MLCCQKLLTLDPSHYLIQFSIVQASAPFPVDFARVTCCYTQFDLTRLEKIDLSRLQNDLDNASSSSSSLAELIKSHTSASIVGSLQKHPISLQRRLFSPAHATCSAHWFLSCHSCLRDLRRGPAKRLYSSVSPLWMAFQSSVDR